MDSPLVSVIIPVYNSERYIAGSIESVLSQNYKPLELIVVDDGSSDRTVDAVKQYSEVKYVYQTNSGPSGARNTGIKKAQGKYIAFLDSDDLWADGKLEKQVGLMEEHLDVALLFGDVQLFDNNHVLMSSMFASKGFDLQFFGDPFYVIDAYRKLIQINYIPTGSVIIRKECLMKTGSFDEGLRLVEDRDLWLRFAMHYSIGYSRDILEFKRHHDDNVSSNTEGMTLSFVKILEKHNKEYRNYLDENHIDLKCSLQKIYRNMGYFYLTNSKLKTARKYFKKSFSCGFEVRTLIYWFSTFIGTNLVDGIRRLREKA